MFRGDEVALILTAIVYPDANGAPTYLTCLALAARKAAKHPTSGRIVPQGYSGTGKDSPIWKEIDASMAADQLPEYVPPLPWKDSSLRMILQL
jgi:hypothetical protein